MKHTLMCLACLALTATTAQARNDAEPSFFNRQTHPVKHLEAELFAGATWPMGRLGDLDNMTGAGIGFEMRYNFNQKPFDVGVQLGINTAVRDVSPTGYGSGEQSNRVALLAVVSDWNFAQGRRVNPFAGLGLGMGRRDVLNDYIYPDNDGTYTLVAQPRVGVELMRHVRLTLSSTLAGKGYNNVELSLGLVLGGRPRK